MISTEVGLGVRPANSYAYLLIASPAGAYFTGGVRPVSVWLSSEYTRAAPGGTGEAKCAGNYAASLVAQAYAAETGLRPGRLARCGGASLGRGDGRDEPVLRLRIRARRPIVTPALTGTLLPGVTRDSLMTLAGELGYTAEEGKISTDEWQEGNSSGAHDRGIRLWHSGGDHAGRVGEERRRVLDGGRRDAGTRVDAAT